MSNITKQSKIKISLMIRKTISLCSHKLADTFASSSDARMVPRISLSCQHGAWRKTAETAVYKLQEYTCLCHKSKEDPVFSPCEVDGESVVM